MNFKFTPLKTAVSVIAFLFGGFYISSFSECIGFGGHISLCIGSMGVSSILQVVVWGLIIGVIVYFIWSLFQGEK